ncbi:hypothetical protein YC2023_089905 [Brassica napus]
MIHLCLELPLLRCIQFVFQPAAPDSSSATPVIISVVAELPIEKLDSSSNGSLIQVAYSVVLSAIAIVGISRGNRLVGIKVKKNDNGDL